MDQQRLVGVAIMAGDLTISLQAPSRHSDIIRGLAEQGIRVRGVSLKANQGFITSDGMFVSRRLARDIAYAANQLKRPVQVGMELTSEDVW